MLLRYNLGGNRPSQTAHLTMSPGRFHDTGLESQCEKSGISRSDPHRLAPRTQSHPPILHRTNPKQKSGYTKGSRGHSVFPRVSGVFTATSISPSPSSRQRPDRYKIRAGRNLPDKEFRSYTPEFSFRYGLSLDPYIPRSATVHFLRDSFYPFETFLVKMIASDHESDHFCKPSKLYLLF